MKRLACVVFALLFSLFMAGCTEKEAAYNGRFPIAGLDWSSTAEDAAAVVKTKTIPSSTLGLSVEATALEVYGYTFKNVRMIYASEEEGGRLYTLTTDPAGDVQAALTALTEKLGTPQTGDSLGFTDTYQNPDSPESYVWLLTDEGSAGDGYRTQVVLYGKGYTDHSDNGGAPAAEWIGKLVLSRKKAT